MTPNDADQCRMKGWKPGTILEGDEGNGPERIVITALGESTVLAKRVMNARGEQVNDTEHAWTLRYRQWRRVQP